MPSAVFKCSYPLSHFPGDTPEARRLSAMDFVDDVREVMTAEVLDVFRSADKGLTSVAVEFREFYADLHARHGEDGERARYLVEVSHPSADLVHAVAQWYGAQEVRR